jgi:hypothetical protein
MLFYSLNDHIHNTVAGWWNCEMQWASVNFRLIELSASSSVRYRSLCYTVEIRLSELRLTETRVNQNAFFLRDSQNCLPRDTSEPLPISLLWIVDACWLYL